MSRFNKRRAEHSCLIRVDGQAINVYRMPAPGKPWTVFVHGHYGNARNWTDVATLLAGRIDGAAVDLPACGSSEPAGCYCVPCTTATLAKTIRSLTGEPVHLVGNSYGGTVCMRLAATRPELVRSLTLISPAVPFLNPSRSSHLTTGLFNRLRRLIRAERDNPLTLDPERLVRRVLADSCGDPAAISAERWAELVADVRLTQALPWRAKAQARSVRGMVWELARSYLPGRGSLRRLARGITASTLVVWGECDRVLDFRLSRGIAGLIPHSRLVVIPGAGHLPHLEAPARVAEAIKSHLSPWIHDG